MRKSAALVLLGLLIVALVGCTQGLSEEQVKERLKNSRDRLVDMRDEANTVLVTTEGLQEEAKGIEDALAKETLIVGSTKGYKQGKLNEGVDIQLDVFGAEKSGTSTSKERILFADGKKYKINLNEIPSEVKNAAKEYNAAFDNLFDLYMFAETIAESSDLASLDNKYMRPHGDVKYEIKVNPTSGRKALYLDGSFIGSEDLENEMTHAFDRRIANGDAIMK